MQYANDLDTLPRDAIEENVTADHHAPQSGPQVRAIAAYPWELSDAFDDLIGSNRKSIRGFGSVTIEIGQNLFKIGSGGGTVAGAGQDYFRFDLTFAERRPLTRHAGTR